MSKSSYFELNKTGLFFNFSITSFDILIVFNGNMWERARTFATTI